MSFFQNVQKPEGFGGRIMVIRMNIRHRFMAEWGLKHIEIQDDDTILDIGCGGGANVKKMSESIKCGKITGIDYSDISVNKTRNKNRSAIKSGRCDVMRGNVMELAFDDRSFSLVTAFETIYFWPDIGEAFKQVYRVLKDDGTFMICNETDGSDADDEKWEKSGIQGLKVYNFEEIKERLQEAGFTEIKADVNENRWLCVVAGKMSGCAAGSNGKMEK